MNDLRRIMLESAGGGNELLANILVLEVFQTTGTTNATDELLLVAKQMLNNVQNNIAFIPLIKFEQEYMIPTKIALSTYEGDTTLNFRYYDGRYRGILITYSSDDTVSIYHYITS